MKPRWLHGIDLAKAARYAQRVGIRPAPGNITDGISTVVNAVQKAGKATSTDVSVMTGMDRRDASTYLARAQEGGILKRRIDNCNKRRWVYQMA